MNRSVPVYQDSFRSSDQTEADPFVPPLTVCMGLVNQYRQSFCFEFLGRGTEVEFDDDFEKRYDEGVF